MTDENFYLQSTISQIDFDKLIKHPNILIAANFWEEDRFNAAKVCYKFMRRIDDFIDDNKADKKSFSDCEKEAFTRQVNEWMACFHQKANNDPFLEEVTETITKFNIPLYLFHNFARSMIYDIHNNGFPTFNDFLNYAEGASVAPASVFVHLGCLNNDHSAYLVPNMDLTAIARPCALFSYIVHIIRDFQKDCLENLNYFADDLLARNQLDIQKLQVIAKSGIATDHFRNMMGTYYNYALVYKHQTEEAIRMLSKYLPERYFISFEVIYQLYLFVFERIDIENGEFTTEELNPSTKEIKEQVTAFVMNYMAKTSV